MPAIATLGHALGFSLAAGVNLYATVAILGLVSRFGWVDLPPSFAVFDSNVVISVALALYLVEFVADKIPWGRFGLGRRPHADPSDSVAPSWRWCPWATRHR